jgi:histidinol dehydrogenase
MDLWNFMRILKYTRSQDQNLIQKLIRRESLSLKTSTNFSNQKKTSTPEMIVEKIVDAVRRQGDSALFYYTRKFDGFQIHEHNCRVTKEEVRKATQSIPIKLKHAFQKAIKNIRRFHEQEMPRSWSKNMHGKNIEQKWVPIDKVGLYVPGGMAAYPSSVMMNVIPAQVAGVSELILATPVKKDGKVNSAVLAVAELLGVQTIFKIGGAQAIAALAYGTKSIPKVDKITGPGNIFVALAKQKIFGIAGIDGFTGPSEVIVISDGKAYPAWIAADLLAQAEHDVMAMPILISTSMNFLKKVFEEIERQIKNLNRKAIAEQAIRDRGALIFCKNIQQVKNLVNQFSPEHLQIVCEDPRHWFDGIRQAGAVFLGEYTPVVFGDFIAGPNHVLPTGGSGRFSSGLSVFDFLKHINILELKKNESFKLGLEAIYLAESEGLTAHAQSALFRMSR